MSTLLHSWSRPDPTRARELVVARPGQVAGEARTRHEMDELGIRPVGGSSLQTWQEALTTGQAAGANLTGSLTATTILPTPAVYTLPANFFNIGKMLKITLAGQLGNIVTTPGTLTLDVHIAAVVAFGGGAMQLSSTAHTTLPFWAEILLTCRAVGSGTSANLMGQGRITGQALSLTAVADSTTTPATLLFPNTVPTVGTGFNSTIANTIDVFATFQLNNANAIQVTQYVLEALN